MATKINSTKKLSTTSQKKPSTEQDPGPSKGIATPFWGQPCHHVKTLSWLTTARSSTYLHRYIPYPMGFCFGLFQIITAYCSGDTQFVPGWGRLDSCQGTAEEAHRQRQSGDNKCRGMCVYVGMHLCMGKYGKSSRLYKDRTLQDRKFFLLHVWEKRESITRSPKSKLLKRMWHCLVLRNKCYPTLSHFNCTYILRHGCMRDILTTSMFEDSWK